MKRFGSIAITLVMVAALALCAVSAFAADVKPPGEQPKPAASLQMSTERQITFLKLQNTQALRTIRMQELEKEYLQIQSELQAGNSQIQAVIKEEAKDLKIEYDTHDFHGDTMTFTPKPEPTPPKVDKPAPDTTAANRKPQRK